MKRIFFLLLAAVLLGSVSVSAQSGNNEPLKGDVNGDGKVDVADINAVIAIMKNGGGTGGETIYKFYTGSTDQEIFTESDLTGSTTTKLTSITVSGATPGSVANIWIYPQSWGTPKSMKSTAINAEMVQAWTFNDTWMTVPSGYTGAWIQVSATSSWNITW